MARKQDWTPRVPGRPHFEILEAMARDMVGDGKKPDLFFVSVDGSVVTISSDFKTAYDAWVQEWRRKKIETTLEDRLWGVIASVEPDEDGSKRLIRMDHSREFLRMYGDELHYEEE